MNGNFSLLCYNIFISTIAVCSDITYSVLCQYIHFQYCDELHTQVNVNPHTQAKFSVQWPFTLRLLDDDIR